MTPVGDGQETWEPEEVEPTRIERPTFADLPGVDELVALAQTVEWLLIQVPVTVTVGEGGERDDPTRADRQRMMAALVPRLPAHAVWDSGFLPDQDSPPAARRNEEGARIAGRSRFSIRRVVTEAALEEHVDLLVAATAEYRRLANGLMRALARQLGVDLSEFTASANWRRHEQVGRLEGEEEWSYFFHGVDCGFKNLSTGVTVEARLGFGPLCGDDFGVFDPGFFLEFLDGSARSEPAYRPLVALLRDSWEDARRALGFLARRGLLRYVISDVVIGRGWVAATETENDAEDRSPVP